MIPIKMYEDNEYGYEYFKVLINDFYLYVDTNSKSVFSSEFALLEQYGILWKNSFEFLPGLIKSSDLYSTLIEYDWYLG